MQPSSTEKQPNTLLRTRIWYAVLLVIGLVFIVRLFYLQVIRHNYYASAARATQLKEYQIPAQRGVIEAYNGDSRVPIVLNEAKYTLFADPKYVEDPADAASKIAPLIKEQPAKLEELMRADSRYAVLKKRLNKTQREKLDALDLKGVGTREELYRTYPQNSLASQVLGFVNDEGKGVYGVEQFLDEDLRGKPGELKAITDAKGVPLVSNESNVVTQPENGKRVVLTIDVSMQQQLEEALKRGLDRAKSKSGGALVIEANTGKIKAMANYPTYSPAKFAEVKDPANFTNGTVAAPLEVGSIMKPLTTAAALDQGVVNRNTSYYDPGQFKVDDATIENVFEVAGAGRRELKDILELSLNTGATWLLMQMGGGQINEKARTNWYEYMHNRYGFGELTGVEQGYESGGTVPDPKDGFGLNIQYANSAFGQGMTATPLQMGAALASVVNGGTYYKPHLVDKIIDANGNETVVQPEAVRQNVVKASVGKDVKEMMEGVVNRNYLVYGMDKLRPKYSIGGKTGTAQIANPAGGYFENKYNGTFSGFVGGDEVKYIVIARVNEPGIPGYAGSRAAGPIFAEMSDVLIDNFNVLPKTK